MDGFIEIIDGLWYEEATGLPWSSRRLLGRGKGWATDGELKPLINNNKNEYYRVSINGKTKKWHRLVFEFFNGLIPSGMVIDHINNNTLDNRISNLQLVNQIKNIKFQKKRKTNSSGYAGVSWHKRDKKWQAQICNDGKTKHLGSFNSPEEASEAYLAAKIKYHGKESIRAL